MARTMRRAVVRGAFRAGLFHFLWATRKRLGAPGRFLILAYHRIGWPGHSGAPGCVSPALFAAHLRLLRRYFAVVSLDRLCEALAAGTLPHADAVAVTLDDGYADAFSAAYPILRAHRIPATIFLPTRFIDDAAPLWWDRVAFLVAAGSTVTRSADPNNRFRRAWLLELPDSAYPAAVRAGLRRAFAGSASALAGVIAALKSMPHATATGLVDDLTERLRCLGIAVDQRAEALTWDQARIMADSGLIDFGAHTVTHAILTRMPPEQAEAEVRESRRVIEARLGRTVRHFAYPNGRHADYSPAIQTLVRAAGYASAATSVPGANRGPHDLFALRRLTVGDEPAAVLALRLTVLSSRWVP
ncbi:MAG: polysaccharide deacetylase family protein [Candidatus Schekmanbacteria bacterium]|nr:polysaccharide deacetylase family protein [Candidatus Schekmanbacteria bacterium]